MKCAWILLILILTGAMAFAQIPSEQQNKDLEQGTPTFPPDQRAPEKPSTESPQTANSDQVPGKVEKATAADDQTLAGQVLEQLWSTPAFSGVVVAAVLNGVVTLEGAVSSREEANRLRQVVEAIPGVKRVQDRVRVEAPIETNSPQTTAPKKNSETSGREAIQENNAGRISGKTTAATSGTARHVQAHNVPTEMSLTAEEVKRQIEKKLASEPGLSSGNVNIQVTTDAIMLSGSVPSVKDVGIVKRIAESYAGNRTLIDRLVIGPGRDRNAIPGLETPPRGTVPDNLQEPENNPR